MESSKQLWPGLQSFIFSRVKFVSFLMCYSPGFFSFLGKKTIITAIMTLWKRMKRIFVSTYLHLRERYGNNNNDNKCSYLFAFFSVITFFFISFQNIFVNAKHLDTYYYVHAWSKKFNSPLLSFWKTEVHGLNLRFLNVESVSRPLSPWEEVKACNLP